MCRLEIFYFIVNDSMTYLSHVLHANEKRMRLLFIIINEFVFILFVFAYIMIRTINWSCVNKSFLCSFLPKAIHHTMSSIFFKKILSTKYL
jgi:hypothetical protein